MVCKWYGINSRCLDEILYKVFIFFKFVVINKLLEFMVFWGKSFWVLKYNFKIFVIFFFFKY